MDTLPNEVLLDIIECLAHDIEAAAHTCLQLVNKRFRRLILQYKYSISVKAAESRYLVARAIYPPPPPGQVLLEAGGGGSSSSSSARGEWLDLIARRSNNIDLILQVMADHVLNKTMCSFHRALWRPLFMAGFFICYRLQGCTTHAEKLDCITTLPLISLALLHTSIQHAMQACPRLYGTTADPDNDSDDNNNSSPDPAASTRQLGLCGCLIECTLCFGPDFLCVLLTSDFMHWPGDSIRNAKSTLSRRYDADDASKSNSNSNCVRCCGGGGPAKGEAKLEDRLKEEFARRDGCFPAEVDERSFRLVQETIAHDHPPVSEMVMARY